MIVKIQIEQPMEVAQEVKECLAMKLEWFGKVRILSIEDDEYWKQYTIGAKHETR